MSFFTLQQLEEVWRVSSTQVKRIVNSGSYKGKPLTVKEVPTSHGGKSKKLVSFDATLSVLPIPISVTNPIFKGLKDGFFIDKLNVKQTHQSGDLRLVGKQGFYYFNLQTGETSELPYVTHLHHEGSYSTSLMIRCDGMTVEVYGNPSRYGRIDNLFGYQSLDECFALYNDVTPKLSTEFRAQNCPLFINFSLFFNIFFNDQLLFVFISYVFLWLFLIFCCFSMCCYIFFSFFFFFFCYFQPKCF
jgi:hypothetical protein